MHATLAVTELQQMCQLAYEDVLEDIMSSSSCSCLLSDMCLDGTLSAAGSITEEEYMQVPCIQAAHCKCQLRAAGFLECCMGVTWGTDAQHC